MITQEQQIEQYVAKIKELSEANENLRGRIRDLLEAKPDYRPFRRTNLDEQMKLEVLAEVYGKLKYTNFVEFRDKLNSLVK